MEGAREEALTLIFNGKWLTDYVRNMMTIVSYISILLGNRQLFKPSGARSKGTKIKIHHSR